jgi:polysaccharide export outer membrane protein
MRVLSLLIVLSLSISSGLSQSEGPITGGSQDDRELVNSGEYVLQALDLLQIRIFQEPEMDREVRISRENTVTLPLVGRVALKGLTQSGAESLLRDLYDRDYLVNPQVNVVVLEYSRRTVNVLGSVNAPGEITFPQEEGLTLLDAISRAGGFTRLAERRKITLTRKLNSGRVETVTIDADELIEGDTEERWKLQTGDLIYVPERFL